MDKNGKNFRELSIQDRVSFLIAESPDGERAVAVRLVS
jgi:cold shock CspA family protein